MMALCKACASRPGEPLVDMADSLTCKDGVLDLDEKVDARGRVRAEHEQHRGRDTARPEASGHVGSVLQKPDPFGMELRGWGPRDNGGQTGVKSMERR